MDKAIEAACRAMCPYDWGDMLKRERDGSDEFLSSPNAAHYRELMSRALQAAAPILKDEHEREVLVALLAEFRAHGWGDRGSPPVLFSFARSRNIDLGEGE